MTTTIIAPTGLGDCAICWVEIEQGSSVKGHDQHLFHSECLTQWIKKKPTCPLCRRNFNSNNDSLRLVFFKVTAISISTIAATIIVNHASVLMNQILPLLDQGLQRY